MTNQEFCYWLQGYFEISLAPNLSMEKIIVIKNTLLGINQPLGSFTQWLYEVIEFFEKQQYKKSIIDYFFPEIMKRLNSIFQHVIDLSYDRKISLEEALKVHDGLLT